MRDTDDDIADKVYGRYAHCFGYAGFWWSDEDENIVFGKPKFGAMSAPGYGKFRVKYVPLFRFWQLVGVLPANEREA